MKISLTNSKLGTQIPSINLPALITCRENAPCASLCYARKGNFCYKNVKQAYMANLEHYQDNPKGYFDKIIDFLNNGLTSYRFLRWHSSGDIVDMEYFEGMIRVAKECSQTKFLAFTKKFELINEWMVTAPLDDKKLPSNLRIVFSMWDKDYNVMVENPYNFPTTWVHFKDENQNGEIPEMAIPCIGKCYECQSCWTLQPGQATVFKQH